MARSALVLLLVAAVAGGWPLGAQPRGRGLTLIAPDGRQTLDTVEIDGRDMIRLDDLAARFDLEVGADTGTGAVTINTPSHTVVLTADQPVATVDGRLVSFDTPPRQVDDGWLVPLDFLETAVRRLTGQPLELRVDSRLLIVGGVRVPRVAGRYRARGSSGQLRLEVTPETPHRVTETADGLIIRFDADAIDIVRLPQAGGGLARDVRRLDGAPGLFVAFGPEYASHRVSTVAAADGTTQLVVDLEAATAPVAEAGPAAPPAAVASPAPASADPLPDLATTSRIRTIVVDAGHGGDDEGARGPDETLEKDVTLAAAQRLAATLERRLGVRVVLTRDRDTTVALDRRAAIANNNKADLFVSLHANSSVSPIPSGAEVFYLSIDEYGAEAREIADRERPSLPVVGGGLRDIDMVLWEMAQVRYLDQSATFARFVDEELAQRVPMSARAIRPAPFRVLVGANMPAVLVEMGFISNPTQARQLRDGAFHTAVADAIVASVLRYQDHLDRLPQQLATEHVVEGTPPNRSDGADAPFTEREP